MRKKKTKYTNIKFNLDLDTYDKLKSIAKLADVTISQAVSVMLALMIVINKEK